MSKEVYFVVGVMSGTSLDGLDMAFCRFVLENKQWTYKILGTHYVDYDNQRVDLLKEAYSCSARRLQEIDTEFGKFIGQQVKGFIANYDMPVDLVSSHGHTIFHEPQKGFSLQIGSGAHIASTSGITSVCGFRDLDVALGGQGAPLVPVGDELLFGEYAACLNLGGFANISFSHERKRIAFDICPLNFVLNRLSQGIGLPFDNNGNTAMGGNLNTDLMDALNSLSYYSQGPPKSLGQEWVEQEVLPLLEQYEKISVEDLLATYTQHAAFQIAKSFEYIWGDSVMVTGGGGYNKYLLELINDFSDKTIVIPSKELVDFKEALVFSFLGVLRSRYETNTLASVTGAKHNSSGGIIYSP